MRWTHALAVCWALVGFVGASAAQEARPPPQPITLTVKAGFSGRIRQEDWSPVRCIVENRSGKRLQGTLSVVLPGDDEAGQTYYAAVDLPSPARRRFTLYIHPQRYVDSISVQLKASELVLTERVPTMTLYGGNPAALVLSRDAMGLFASARQPEFGGLDVVEGQVDDLPEKAAGYGPMDVILWNGLSLRDLRPEQERALYDWLLDGGTLIVATGRYANSVEGSALEALLPVDIEETIERTVLQRRTHALPRRGRSIRLVVPRFDGALLLAKARLREDGETLLADEGGLPLVAGRDIGLGAVVYLAFDLSVPALLYHPEQAQLYQSLLEWACVIGYEEQFRRYGTQPAWGRNAARQQAIYQTAVARAPSLFWVMVFLGVYVLVIGPLDYLVLKLCRRRHLTIVTFPLIVAAFTAASYYFASSFKGCRVFVNEITVLHQRGERVHARTHFGVYSPRKQAYNIAVAEPSATVLPLSEESAAGGPMSRRMPRPQFSFSGGARWTQGGSGLTVWGPSTPIYPTEVTEEAAITEMFRLMQRPDAVALPDTAVEMWAMRSFYADWWPDVGALHAQLRYEGEHVIGEIANKTRFDLENCLLLLGNVGHPLETLGAGETRTVRARIPLSKVPTTFPDETLIGGIDAEERNARLAVLESLGLRPYNTREAMRSYGASWNELRRWRRQYASALGTSEAALAGVAIVGWTREPLLPVQIEGYEPGRRAVNMWLLRPAYWGMARPVEGIWEAPYLTPDPFGVRSRSGAMDFGRERWAR